VRRPGSRARAGAWGQNARVEHTAEGWQPDPFGRHEQRWISAGTATDLVRDGAREARDPPVPAPAPPAPPRHWIDVHRLPTAERRRLPWPLDRIPPPYPVPERKPWRVVASVVLMCCAAFVAVALSFGHAVLPAPSLGRDETMGTVTYVDQLDQPSTFFVVSYSPQGQPDVGGVAAGSDAAGVADGQSVVVRYDPAHPTFGTVVSTNPPGSRVDGILGWIVVPLELALAFWFWSSSGYRLWRRRRALEEETDYREDQWAGTTNSA
jgi:hypothetical protein